MKTALVKRVRLSNILYSFLLLHLFSNWTLFGGRNIYHRHARFLQKVRFIGEPFFVLVGLSHVIQGTYLSWKRGVMFQQRCLSGWGLLLFLAYHRDSMRRQPQLSFDATTKELRNAWYVFELGLITLALHLKRPWVSLGFAIPVVWANSQGNIKKNKKKISNSATFLW